MLIVEGGDLVGKTTLCKKLADKLAGSGHMYQHLSRLPHGHDRLHDYIALAGQRQIRDRFHMSEIAYVTARGERHERLTPEKYRLVDAHLRLLGSFTVVVVCGDHDMLKHRYAVNSDREMYDMKVTVRVNDIFTGIALGQECEDFDPDFDLVIETSQDKPFPTDVDVTTIFELYRARQDHLQLHYLGGRRP